MFATATPLTLNVHSTHSLPLPQAPIIMAVYGGVLGLLTTPIAALAALVTAGRWMTEIGGVQPNMGPAEAAAARRAAMFSTLPQAGPAPVPSVAALTSGAGGSQTAKGGLAPAPAPVGGVGLAPALAGTGGEAPGMPGTAGSYAVSV